MFAGWYLFAALAVFALIATTIVVFATATARARSTDGSPIVVRVTLWVAVAWAVFSVIGATVIALTTLMQDDIRVIVPVQEFWPQLPDGVVVEGPTATIWGGGFTSAELLTRDLSTGVRSMWAIAQAFAWLVPGTIAAMIAVACYQLLAGRAFAPVVARMAMVTAVVVATGGIAAQVLGDIAGSMASTELLFVGASRTPADIPGIEHVLDAWWPAATFSITFPFWPIAAGLAFAALAAILRYGSRLQRDTEGLV